LNAQPAGKNRIDAVGFKYQTLNTGAGKDGKSLERERKFFKNFQSKTGSKQYFRSFAKNIPRN